jgi:uncharacterized protein (TIGR02246 family)
MKEISVAKKTTPSSGTSGEAAIREIITARSRAVSDGDPDAIVANVAEDVTIFDVIPPLMSQGKAAARDRAVQWLGSYDGPVRWETSQVAIVASDDVAFSHFASHVTGTLKTGDAIDMWFRTTLGFRRTNSGWRIVHDHSSDPFDPVSGKAKTDLKP